MKAERIRKFLHYHIPFVCDVNRENKVFNYERDAVLKELRELEDYAELGRATQWLLEECYYNLAFAESKQIDCTNGGLYITDAESIIDLYEGLKNDVLKRKDKENER
jgi:hypothetical protein